MVYAREFHAYYCNYCGNSTDSHSKHHSHHQPQQSEIELQSDETVDLDVKYSTTDGITDDDDDAKNPFWIRLGEHAFIIKKYIISTSLQTSNMTFAITLSTMVVISALMALIVLSATLSWSSPSTIADLNQTQEAEVAGARTELIMEADKEDAILLVSLLANELETRLNKSGAILEITSKLPEVTSTPFADSISPELHGIPRDADMPKRKVAQDILAADKDFQVIFFLMPNGDAYLDEPYSRQENLTVNNFAFRDYFKGPVETGNTYLGNVFVSTSSGQPQANIAVPVYSNNGSLVGVWSGGLNFSRLSNSLQSLNLTSTAGDDERIVYVDGQGQKIADSYTQLLLPANTTTQSESFADLQAFKNAINGQSGSTTEIVNNTMMRVSYHPVKTFSNTWVILFMQPYENETSTNNAG
ncbi:MAG TPA: cache domain-containing protein [Nitrososphaera sp.]